MASIKNQSHFRHLFLRHFLLLHRLTCILFNNCLFQSFWLAFRGHLWRKQTRCLFFPVTSPAARKNGGVACFFLLRMKERRRRGCLLTPLTKLHLPVPTFQPAWKVEMITQETNPVYWAFTHCLTLEPLDSYLFQLSFWQYNLKDWVSQKLELSFQPIDFEISFIRTK